MLRKLTICLLLFLFIAISLFSSAYAADIHLAATAGGVGGTWYSTLGALSGLLNEKDSSIRFTVSPGGGVANPGTIGEGQFDIGWVYPTFAKLAYEGKDVYQKEYKDLRIMATNFSPNYFELSILADSDISSLEEIFKEKRPVRFLTGKQSTSTGFFFIRVLQFYNSSVEEIESWGGKVLFRAYSDWAGLVQDGHVDIMFNQIALPSAVLQEILTHRDVKLLPFSEDFRDYMAPKYALEKVIIPAGTYSFLKEDIPSLRFGNALAVNKNVSDEAIYRILEILDQNLEEVKSIHPSWKNFDTRNAWKNPGIPLHPAAEKFYKDKGYMK